MKESQPEATGVERSLLGEIFAVSATASTGAGAPGATKSLQSLHERLSSPVFVEQMTRVFFKAKRAALAATK